MTPWWCDVFFCCYIVPYYIFQKVYYNKARKLLPSTIVKKNLSTENKYKHVEFFFNFVISQKPKINSEMIELKTSAVAMIVQLQKRDARHISSGVKFFWSSYFSKCWECLCTVGVPAIDVETKSCPLQIVLDHSPDGCLVVACWKVFYTFNQAADVLRLLTTNFPLRFSPETKIQSFQVSGMDRPVDRSATSDDSILKFFSQIMRNNTLFLCLDNYS